MTTRLAAASLALGLLITPALARQMADMAKPAPADQAFMTGMTSMNNAMSSAPMTGDADRDFVTMMEPHHRGAVDMARVELRYGKDAELRRLAAGIIKAQDREIGLMERWQAAHPVR